MAVILKRPRALIDLAEIWAYFAEDSIVNADAFAALIDKKLRLLAKQPGMGGPGLNLATGCEALSLAATWFSISLAPKASRLSAYFMAHGTSMRPSKSNKSEIASESLP